MPKIKPFKKISISLPSAIHAWAKKNLRGRSLSGYVAELIKKDKEGAE